MVWEWNLLLEILPVGWNRKLWKFYTGGISCESYCSLFKIRANWASFSARPASPTPKVLVLGDTGFTTYSHQSLHHIPKKRTKFDAFFFNWPTCHARVPGWPAQKPPCFLEENAGPLQMAYQIPHDLPSIQHKTNLPLPGPPPTFLPLACFAPVAWSVFLRHTFAFAAVLVWKVLPPQNSMARSLTSFTSVPKCHLLNGASLNHFSKNWAPVCFLFPTPTPLWNRRRMKAGTWLYYYVPGA